MPGCLDAFCSRDVVCSGDDTQGNENHAFLHRNNFSCPVIIFVVQHCL